MFANALRTHTRLALASSRQISAVTYAVVPRQSTGVFSRTLSTFRTLRQGLDDYGFGSRNAHGETSFRREASPSNTLFVGNIPYTVDEAELRAQFADFGEIKSVRIGMTSDGRARGFGHVEFAELEDAVSACEAIKNEPIQMLDRSVRVDFAPPRLNTTAPAPNRKLYVSEFDGGEDALRAAFAEFESSILGVHLLKDPLTGSPMGAGFVEFMSVDRATEALTSINGTTAEGLKFKVAYARPPRTREMRGSGNHSDRSTEYGHSNTRKGYGSDWGGGKRGSDYHSGGGRGRGGGRY